MRLYFVMFVIERVVQQLPYISLICQTVIAAFIVRLTALRYSKHVMDGIIRCLKGENELMSETHAISFTQSLQPSPHSLAQSFTLSFIHSLRDRMDD